MSIPIHRDSENVSTSTRKPSQHRKPKSHYREQIRIELSQLPTLPEGWAYVSAETVCSSVRDGTHDTPAYCSEGVPLITSKNLLPTGLDFENTKSISEDDYFEISRRSGVDEGDVLFAMIGTVGNPVVVETNRKFSIKNVGLFKKNPSVILPRFLKHWLACPQFKAWLEPKQKGTTQKFVPLGLLRAIPVPLAPLSEQHSIVAEIEQQFTRLDAGVASLKRVRAALKRYRASVLKAACEGRLVATEAELARQEGRSYETGKQLLARILDERRDRLSTARKTKPVGCRRDLEETFPEGWTTASLDELFLNVTDGDHQPPPQTDSGVPFLVIGNLRSGRLDFGKTRFVSRTYADQIDMLRKPRRDDILYSLVGSFGIAVTVETELEFCIQRHIAILRPHRLSPIRFLRYILNSGLAFSQAVAVATGTAQKTVPLAGLRAFALPLPPVAEQHRIVAELERRFSVIEALEAIAAANITRAYSLRQSILQRAFSGNLLGSALSTTTT
jgi:type I restriction enzyme S subunit